MGFLDVFLIGVGLSMDAFAVTISNSMSMPGLSRTKRLVFPAAFGVFQLLMPLIGYLAGSLFAGYIMAVAGVFTFVVLLVLGAKMAREGYLGLRDAGAVEGEGFSARLVLLQAVATSIDALAVGVSFAGYADFAILPSVCLIGATTFCICFVALEIGKRLGLKFGPKAQIAGGAILVLIGIKALLG